MNMLNYDIRLGLLRQRVYFTTRPSHESFARFLNLQLTSLSSASSPLFLPIAHLAHHEFITTLIARYIRRLADEKIMGGSAYVYTTRSAGLKKGFNETKAPFIIYQGIKFNAVFLWAVTAVVVASLSLRAYTYRFSCSRGSLSRRL